ncbi:MAG: pyridoxamine 5'-phosphate oxidase family protein [Ilumatobacteraceae bacterium]
MTNYQQAADAFIHMAHRIVWASVAMVEPDGRPRSRVLHPIWEWAGDELVGWIMTGKTPIKTAALAGQPAISLNYWSPSHDTCEIDCVASWADDAVTRHRTWHLFSDAPQPVGYDPRIIPGWDSADSPSFSVLRLHPYRLRVFPGTVLLGQGGEIVQWHS